MSETDRSIGMSVDAALEATEFLAEEIIMIPGEKIKEK